MQKILLTVSRQLKKVFIAALLIFLRLAGHAQDVVPLVQPFEHHHALGARLFFVQHLQHLLLGFRSKDMVEITPG
jgi:uncharacterized membrane protein